MKMPDMEKLLDIGIAFTTEKDIDSLFVIILNAVMDITGCDGGTLYLLRDDALWFQVMITRSLGLQRGPGGDTIDLPPVPLSRQNVCSRAALDKTLINVENIYTSESFDFTGAKKYDALTGYKTVSMLTVPMEDDHGDVIGVLQLINAMDEGGAVVPFAPGYNRVLSSVASQGAICLTNRNYAAEVSELLDSFVRAISAAIDARSPYNANHTRNMTRYGQKFVSWLNASGAEAFDDERERQFLMSIWLHDIGKLAVPLAVMDKESRLGDKLERVQNRLQRLRLQSEIDFLRETIDLAAHKKRLSDLDHARALVEDANQAGFLPDGTLEEIGALGKKTMPGPDGEEALLTPDELTCLTVRRGTLTDEERRVMEGHVLITRRMLSEVRFPKNYRSVPGWASAHHEYLNGKGYPDGLTAETLPTETRMLTILDIYDALTARDRPYKPALPTEKAFSILEGMAEQGQLDGRLLGLFKQSGAWVAANI